MEFKYFGKWQVEDVVIKDPGLQRYIKLQPGLVMRTGGKHAGKQFGKAEVPVVERLINKIMRSGPGVRKLGESLLGAPAPVEKNSRPTISSVRLLIQSSRRRKKIQFRFLWTLSKIRP